MSPVTHSESRHAPREDDRDDRDDDRPRRRRRDDDDDDREERPRRRREDEDDDREARDDRDDDRPRRRRDDDDRDEDYRPRRRRRDRDDDDAALGGLIPYKNGMALAAYYCGVFSFIPLCWGLLSLLAIIFGFVGLSKANKHPEAKGKGHAIAGIVCGSITLLLAIAVSVYLALVGVK